jgi:protein-tyrosine phosphatase
MSGAGDILRLVYGRLFGHPMNFSFIDEFVAGSALPMSKKEVEWLKRKKGIQAILTLTEYPLKEEYLVGLEYENVPIKNHIVPAVEQLRESVKFLLAESSAGRKVLVHCAAGQGRTGTVLAAYLCAKYGTSPEQAIKQVRMKRSGSIEKKQESAVWSFHDQMKPEKSG